MERHGVTPWDEERCGNLEVEEMLLRGHITDHDHPRVCCSAHLFRARLWPVTVEDQQALKKNHPTSG